MPYFEELAKAMVWLAEQPDTVFLGQQVEYAGNALYKTLSGVPMSKRIEMPVVEDMQMGISIGMALVGKVPITIYPRMDFLLCAVNQLVNHLDKYPSFVIIRTCVGSKVPLDPGPQHSGDYTMGLRNILKNVRLYILWASRVIEPIYRKVYTDKKPAIVVEYGDLYGIE